jgi:hypothetical protein
MVSFFFQKKKQEALVLHRTRLYNNSLNGILLFPEKEAKSVSYLHTRLYNNSSNDVTFLETEARALIFFFSRKESKALVLLRRRLWATQTSAKPTQGVWGHCPQEINSW